MDTQELSELISQHRSVLSTFREIVEWAQNAKDFAFKADAALYLPEYDGIAVIAHLVNKSGSPETILGWTARTKGQGRWPTEVVMAQDPPAALAWDGWQRSGGLRLEAMDYCRVVLYFPVGRWIKEWFDLADRADPLRDAFSLEVETLEKMRADSSVDLYTAVELRRSIEKRLTP